MDFGSRADPFVGYRQAITQDGEPASDIKPVLFYIETEVRSSVVKWHFRVLHDTELTITQTCRTVRLFDELGHTLSVSDIGYSAKGMTVRCMANWDYVYPG